MAAGILSFKALKEIETSHKLHCKLICVLKNQLQCQNSEFGLEKEFPNGVFHKFREKQSELFENIVESRILMDSHVEPDMVGSTTNQMLNVHEGDYTSFNSIKSKSKGQRPYMFDLVFLTT